MTWLIFEGFISTVPTATQRLLDHLIEGGLEQYVRDKRQNGLSWRRISLDIRDRFDVDITYQTLMNWYGKQDAAA